MVFSPSRPLELSLSVELNVEELVLSCFFFVCDAFSGDLVRCCALTVALHLFDDKE